MERYSLEYKKTHTKEGKRKGSAHEAMVLFFEKKFWTVLGVKRVFYTIFTYSFEKVEGRAGATSVNFENNRS